MIFLFMVLIYIGMKTNCKNAGQATLSYLREFKENSGIQVFVDQYYYY